MSPKYGLTMNNTYNSFLHSEVHMTLSITISNVGHVNFHSRSHLHFQHRTTRVSRVPNSPKQKYINDLSDLVKWSIIPTKYTPISAINHSDMSTEEYHWAVWGGNHYKTKVYVSLENKRGRLCWYRRNHLLHSNYIWKQSKTRYMKISLNAFYNWKSMRIFMDLSRKQYTNNNMIIL